jgi:hypothetical protein
MDENEFDNIKRKDQENHQRKKEEKAMRQISRGFVYGSTATPFTKKDSPVDPTHTHKWSGNFLSSQSPQSTFVQYSS